MEPLKIRMITDFECPHITKLQLLHVKKTTKKFTEIKCSLTYYVTHISIVYGVVHVVISIEIYVVF